jgi:hypothetical protein
MRVEVIVSTVIIVLVFFTAGPALAADDSKVKSATERVETGAKKIGQGEVGQGVKETAKGIGETVSRAPSTPARS